MAEAKAAEKARLAEEYKAQGQARVAIRPSPSPNPSPNPES